MTDLLYFAGKETHDALVKQTKDDTIKGCIKYLEENGYVVTPCINKANSEVEDG